MWLVCIFPECKTTACFNNESESNGLYCNVHKLNGMINVNRRYCIYPGCKITANYNNYGEKIPLYCMTHKLDTMVNITNKRCIYTDCDIRPNYNFEGQKISLYCKWANTKFFSKMAIFGIGIIMDCILKSLNRLNSSPTEKFVLMALKIREIGA